MSPNSPYEIKSEKSDSKYMLVWLQACFYKRIDNFKMTLKFQTIKMFLEFCFWNVVASTDLKLNVINLSKLRQVKKTICNE